MSTTTYTVVNGQVLSQNKDGVVSYFVSDPLGSVVMVRDNAGNTVYEAEYDPYGNVQSETGTNPSEFGYVGTLGYVKDSASSLYVRARYLMTPLGRWLTKDPLWPDEPGFVYAGASPNRWVDPSGKQWLRNVPYHDHFHPCLKDPLGCFNEAFCLDPDGFWSSGTWSYGNCCGPTKRCNSGSPTNGSCADLACRDHDGCVATFWEFVTSWRECNNRLCRDLRACWNSDCSGPSVMDPRHCRAIQNIAWTFCNSQGTGVPGDLGEPWNPPPIGGVPNPEPIDVWGITPAPGEVIRPGPNPIIA